jgi:predicted amidophosphoribosyltransferase
MVIKLNENIKCGKCKTPVERSMDYCPECGNKLNIIQNDYLQILLGRKENLQILIILIIFIIFYLIWF